MNAPPACAGIFALAAVVFAMPSSAADARGGGRDRRLRSPVSLASYARQRDAQSRPASVALVGADAFSELDQPGSRRDDPARQRPGVAALRWRSPVLTGAGACGSVLVLEDRHPDPSGRDAANVNELFEVNLRAGRRDRGPCGAAGAAVL
jgi:hypothetical protein